MQCVPQTDVVLHRKLDPVDNLRKLWYHCQQCDTNKVLEHASTRHSQCQTEIGGKTEISGDFFANSIQSILGTWEMEELFSSG